MFPDISAIIGGLDPSQWSSALASAGVPPDALTANAQESAPQASPWEPMGPPEPAAGMVGGPPGPPQVGGAGVPRMGMDPAAAPAAQPPGGGGPALVQALRGMVAPNVPQPQKVSTPSAPHPTGKIEGGGLISLLNHLGMLRGAQMPTSYQLPSTLGAALGGR